MDMSEIVKAIRAGLKVLEATAPMRLSVWAEKHFYLSSESSYVEGRWKAYPYQTAILDAIGNDEIEEVNLMKSARVGYTKMILAGMAYFAEHKRRNQGVWQPTDDDSDEFCKTELEPMLRDVPAMQTVFPAYLQRHKDNTLKQKKFLSSILHLRGGKAAKNYRRLSLDIAWMDEIDGFDLDVEGEGSAVKLAAKRLEGAIFPKQVIGSTPKQKGFSIIEARHDQAEVRYRRHIPCPHCGTMIQLSFGGKDKPHGFKWGDDPENVGHLCGICASLFTQAEYLAVWEQGRWVGDDGSWIDDASGLFYGADGIRQRPPRHISFHIWTAYSPQASWAQIVREFISAKSKSKTGDKGELKTFVNTTLGETWEEEAEKADAHELAARSEDYPLRHVPVGGLVLVAGVDVQDNRFEIVVWAIGKGEEMWAVDYSVLDANPADERDWERLHAFLQTPFDHLAGGALKIEAAAIDTGGHFTHQVYAFCRSYQQRRYYAIKGVSRDGFPVKGRSSLQDVNWRGKIIKRGVRLWDVGTDTAKDLMFGRLRVTQSGPGYVHFSKHLPSEFFHQLTAEQRVMQRTARGDVFRWVKTRARNEVLDCTVYATFAAHMLDLHRYTERQWQRLADAVQPKNGDLFVAAPEKAAEAGKAIDAAPPVMAGSKRPALPRRVGGITRR
jgi:terminase, large subunit